MKHILVLEYCGGGTLFSKEFWKLKNEKRGKKPEDRDLKISELLEIFQEIVEAVSYSNYFEKLTDSAPQQYRPQRPQGRKPPLYGGSSPQNRRFWCFPRVQRAVQGPNHRCLRYT